MAAQGKVIKVCMNPMCDEVAHFIEKAEKRCRNCNTRMIAIDEKTYWAKYAENYFQYDYRTGDFYYPARNSQSTS
jgi:hypothetical protein